MDKTADKKGVKPLSLKPDQLKSVRPNLPRGLLEAGFVFSVEYDSKGATMFLKHPSMDELPPLCVPWEGYAATLKGMGFLMSFTDNKDEKRARNEILVTAMCAGKSPVDSPGLVGLVQKNLELTRKNEAMFGKISDLFKPGEEFWLDHCAKNYNAVKSHLDDHLANVILGRTSSCENKPEAVNQWYWGRMNSESISAEARFNLDPNGKLPVQQKNLVEWLFPQKVTSHIYLLAGEKCKTLNPLMSHVEEMKEVFTRQVKSKGIDIGVEPEHRSTASMWYKKLRFYVPCPTYGRMKETQKDLRFEDWIPSNKIPKELKFPGSMDPLKAAFISTRLRSGIFPRDNLRTDKRNNLLRIVMGAESYDKIDLEPGSKADKFGKKYEDAKFDQAAIAAGFGLPCGWEVENGQYKKIDPASTNLLPQLLQANGIDKDLAPKAKGNIPKLLPPDGEVEKPMPAAQFQRPSKCDVDRFTVKLELAFPAKKAKKERGVSANTTFPMVCKAHRDWLREHGLEGDDLKMFSNRLQTPDRVALGTYLYGCGLVAIDDEDFED